MLQACRTCRVEKGAAQITDQDKVVLSLKTQRNKLNAESKLVRPLCDDGHPAQLLVAYRMLADTHMS